MEGVFDWKIIAKNVGFVAEIVSKFSEEIVLGEPVMRGTLDFEYKLKS